MGAHPPGTNVGGRPRQIERELGRLREAAGHVDNLIEQNAILQVLDRDSGSVLGMLGANKALQLQAAKDEIRTKIADIERAVQLIEEICGEGSLTGKRPLGSDASDQRLMQAGAGLDRLAARGQG